MKASILAILLVACGLQTLPAGDFVGSRLSQFKESSYDFRITKSALASAPSWDADADAPPLPPLMAHLIALTQAKKLRPEVTQWKLDSIRLEPVGGGRPDTYLHEGWIYVVTLQDLSGPIAGVPWQLEIPVYFDGETITPKVTKRKP
jgi:hypothetical protein